MTFTPVNSGDKNTPCISLIGMAGAGKSTLAPLLAKSLSWAHLDTDRHLEAFYAMPLQSIYDAYGRDEFLHIEETLVSQLNLMRTVISTGGSVIYGPKAIARLKELGTVVYLDISEEVFLARVGNADDRGLAIPKGMTMSDLYRERNPLYASAADLTIRTDNCEPDECVRQILEQMDFS